MHVLGIDPGYGYTKVVDSTGQRLLFPSVVTQGHGSGLADLFGRRKMMSNLHVTMNKGSFDRNYFVGELAIEDINSSFNYDDMKGFSENQEVLIATSAAIMNQYNTKKKGIHLVTGLPLEYYQSQKDEYKKMLEKHNSLVTINNYLEPVDIKFDKVTIFPQGAGAINYTVLNNGKEYVVRNSYIALVDVGHKTTDIVVFYADRNSRLIFTPQMSGTVNTGTKFVSMGVEERFM